MRKEASGAISFEGNQLVVVASALKRPITQKRPADTLYEKRKKKYLAQFPFSHQISNKIK